jgi:hypothetical protein
MRAESEFFAAGRQVSRSELEAGEFFNARRKASVQIVASDEEGRFEGRISQPDSPSADHPTTWPRRRYDCERYLSWMRYRHAWELELPGQLLLKYA